MNKTSLRKLVILLLDDQDGISQEAYVALQDFILENDGQCDDIFDMAIGTKDRWYLPEDHGILA